MGGEPINVRAFVTSPRHHVAVDVTTLDREVYSEADAAEILRVAPSTLHWWLEGRRQGSKVYAPVLRPEPTGFRSLTWAEFVEAALLRQYRREFQVRLQEIRDFIATLREKEGIPYPLRTTALGWVRAAASARDAEEVAASGRAVARCSGQRPTGAHRASGVLPQADGVGRRPVAQGLDARSPWCVGERSAACSVV